MIKIGPMVFCISCFNEEFSGVWDVDSNEIDTKSQEYQDWLEAYKKYIDETYKGT
jgi:putative methionine-R-sulfoxide reductase with GAF domain